MADGHLVRQMGQTFADGISSCGYFYFVGHLPSRREKQTGKKRNSRDLRNGRVINCTAKPENDEIIN